MAETIYCQKSSFTETDWEKIYEVAFRPDQRTPLSQLHEGLKSGQMLLHRSSNKDGLLCFSVTNVLPSVALLAYLATDPKKQSSGIGSKHMKSLIAQVRADHPGLIGMFAEIESTREKGISEDEKKHRRRRLAFYQRLGFKRYKSVYTIPSYEKAIPDEEGELIWLEFNTGTIGCEKVAEVIKEIYVKAYLLKDDDHRVTGVPVLTGDAAACEIPDDGSTSASPQIVDTTAADATVKTEAKTGDTTSAPMPVVEAKPGEQVTATPAATQPDGKAGETANAPAVTGVETQSETIVPTAPNATAQAAADLSERAGVTTPTDGSDGKPAIEPPSKSQSS